VDFSKLAQFSVGLAAFLGGLWIVLLIIRSIKNGRIGHHASTEERNSGQQPIVFWRTEFREAVKEVLTENAPKRHEDMERLMERVIEREFRKRDNTLRDLIRQELSRR
jgi:hydrogenase maturation factor HypE